MRINVAAETVIHYAFAKGAMLTYQISMTYLTAMCCLTVPEEKGLNIDVHRNISFLDIKDTLFIYIVKGMVERIICFTVLPLFCVSFGIIWPMTSSYISLPSSSSRVLQVSLCVVFRFLTCERITFIILRVHTNNLNSKIYIFERQNSIEWERKRSFFLWFISQMDTDWNQEPGMSSGSPTWMTGIQTFGQPSPALRCVLARS